MQKKYIDISLDYERRDVSSREGHKSESEQQITTSRQQQRQQLMQWHIESQSSPDAMQTNVRLSVDNIMDKK